MVHQLLKWWLNSKLKFVQLRKSLNRRQEGLFLGGTALLYWAKWWDSSLGLDLSLRAGCGRLGTLNRTSFGGPILQWAVHEKSTKQHIMCYYYIFSQHDDLQFSDWHRHREKHANMQTQHGEACWNRTHDAAVTR